MSQSICKINECERLAHSHCRCCYQNLCLSHLKEHKDALILQLDPLTDDLDLVHYQLVSIDVKELLKRTYEELLEWRDQSYKIIDKFIEEKYKELENIVMTKIAKQKDEIRSIREGLDELLQIEQTCQKDIDTIKAKIYRLNQSLTDIEQTSFKVNSDRLIIDKNIIQFEPKKNLYTILSSLFKTVTFSEPSLPIIASSNKNILIHQNLHLWFIDSNFRILKKIPWHLQTMHDVCWSSSLDRYILTTDLCGICFATEKSISVNDIDYFSTEKFHSCTCSNTSLYLTTDTLGSSILEFRLLPSIELIQQWKSPDTCEQDEYITSIRYNNGRLGLLIEKNPEKNFKIESRCAKTLNRFWSIKLDMLSKPYECVFCTFNNYDWLCISKSSSGILHITKDGKIIDTCDYSPKPCNGTVFGENLLAILTEYGINFHKL